MFQALEELSEQGEMGKITFKKVDERMRTIGKKCLNPTLLWEFALLGYVMHTKKSWFSAKQGFSVYMHTWRINPKRKVNDILDAIEKYKEYKEEHSEDKDD